MSTVLLTGGLGFIGSHLTIPLIKNGYKVVILDSLYNSSKNKLDHIKNVLRLCSIDFDGRLFFRKADIRNIKILSDIFHEFNEKKISITSVIHCAGLKSVQDSISYPLMYWENNVIGAINLLKVMSKYNCKNIVFSSSATIYKSKLNYLLKEDSKFEPINPYGVSKLTVEKFLEDIFRSQSKEWKIASLRYFNPVGAHSSGLLGETPLRDANNLFPILLNVALKKNKELYIFGNNYPTNDGTCVRDYIHIMDLADAHISTLEYLLNNKSQIISLNIGTGKGKSVLEVIETFKNINGCDIPFKFVERRKGDAPFVVADNSLALSILDWYPKRTFEDMCKDSWNSIIMNL